MYSLHLTCRAEEVDDLSFALWEADTVGIREQDCGKNDVELIAGFEDAVDRGLLSLRFAGHEPEWEREDETDWVAATEEVWPGREVGGRIFLAPVWNTEQTPSGRIRVVHNPGQASGTGEHSCTQLALEGLERSVSSGCVVIDVGTGSGILSIAALRLGSQLSLALDMDLTALVTARENYILNDLAGTVALGSAECVASEVADVVVANISGTVLLSIADELLRIAKPGGKLILTGFPESELSALEAMFGDGEVSRKNEWRCLTLLV